MENEKSKPASSAFDPKQFKKMSPTDLQKYLGALILITVLALGYSTYILWNAIQLTYYGAEGMAVYAGDCGSFYSAQYQFSDRAGESFKPCLSTFIFAPQEVRVFYDPQNPNNTADVANWITGIFFALIGILGVFSVYLVKRAKKN